MRPLFFLILAAALFAANAAQVASSAEEIPWSHPSHPFRIPVEVEFPAEGTYSLQLNAEAITKWLNQGQSMPLRSEYFNHNGVRLVEITKEGHPKENETDGRFVMQVGPELIRNGDFERSEAEKPEDWSIPQEGFSLSRDSNGNHYLEVKEGASRAAAIQTPTVKPDTWYRYSHRASGAVAAGPQVYYTDLENWLPPSRSYFDPNLPSEGWHEREFFFYSGDMSNWHGGKLRVVMEQFPGKLDDVSLRECEVRFVVHADSPGKKHFLLYYAPLEGITPTPPQEHVTELPETILEANPSGAPEWLTKDLEYRLADTSKGIFWFASPIVKLSPDTPAPRGKQHPIRLSGARNESEAFQIVFRPEADGRIERISVELQTPDGNAWVNVPLDLRIADYVTIHEPSKTGWYYSESARTGFTGQIADPLPAFKPFVFRKGESNIPIWFDLSIPKDAIAGLHRGKVLIETPSETIEIPLELQVWDFALPDKRTMRGSFQFAQYANRFLFPFHKAETREDKYELSRAYIQELARYGFQPADPQSGGVWHPDIEGAPGTQDLATQIAILERELRWAFDELSLNSARVGHVSGWGSHIENPDNAEKDAERYDQIAEMLIRNGWIDRCFIMIDEPTKQSYPAVRHWVQALKRKPHASQLALLACVYHGYAYDELSEMFDILVPFNNDRGSSVSPEAIATLGNDTEFWFYWTNSMHMWIDSPGINHRFWAPKTWAWRGKGMLLWSVNQWWTIPGSPHEVTNPWEDPGSTWGNGALSYFYPPNPVGEDLPDTDLSIVPSLRLLVAREGFDDVEYLVRLEALTGQAESNGIDTSSAQDLLRQTRDFFATPVSWHVSGSKWLMLRESIAKEIVALESKLL